MKKRNLQKRKAHANLPLSTYTDETGNSGFNLFDPAQPMFWTGTLVSSLDIHTQGISTVAECCESLGVQELHGNELGLGRIQKIASRVKSLLVKLDCQFVFTQVDKTFLAATKLTDTVLDSGTNPAVSHFHYFSPFRGLLELQLIPLLSFGDLRNFWVAYEKRDCEKFRRTLEGLQGKVLDQVSDPRAKEIWMDALSWAARNPEKVLVAKRHEWDSPNLIAFMTLVDEVKKIAYTRNANKIEFFHDEQSQFGKSMKWTFDLMKGIESEEKNFFITLVRKGTSLYKGPMQILSSKASPGLQLIDITLWVFKRHIENQIPATSEETLTFLWEISKRAQVVRFDLDTYRKKVNEALEPFMSGELTEKQEERARSLMRQSEAERIKRMNSK